MILIYILPLCVDALMMNTPFLKGLQDTTSMLTVWTEEGGLGGTAIRNGNEENLRNLEEHIRLHSFFLGTPKHVARKRHQQRHL